MKQKLLNWWDRHSLQVYETLFLLSTIMVVGSLLLFIVFVAALGSGTSGGKYSMEAFVEFITGSWKEPSHIYRIWFGGWCINQCNYSKGNREEVFG